MKYNNEYVKSRLFEMQDLKYRDFHNKLCPGVDNIIGVRLPNIKKLAKEISKTAKEEYICFIENSDDKYYEKIMLQGLVIGNSKLELEERLKYIASFVPKINNWAVCDCFCCSLKFIEKSKEAIWNFIQKYLNSDNEFDVRFALVILLNYYLEEKYITEIFKITDNINSGKYYINMAEAWLIAECYIMYPEISIKYLNNNKLNDFVHNKCLQKICESYRVSKDTKNELKKLKRCK